MCKKIWNKNKTRLRSELRNLEVGEKIEVLNKPQIVNISTIRVSASTLGTDMGRKYSVNKNGDLITIMRRQ